MTCGSRGLCFSRADVAHIAPALHRGATALLLPLLPCRRPGFTLVKEYAVPAELSHPGRGGKEAMLLFRKD